MGGVGAQPRMRACFGRIGIRQAGQRGVRPAIRQQLEVPGQLRVRAWRMRGVVTTREGARHLRLQRTPGEDRARRQQQGQARHGINRGSAPR